MGQHHGDYRSSLERRDEAGGGGGAGAPNATGRPEGGADSFFDILTNSGI